MLCRFILADAAHETAGLMICDCALKNPDDAEQLELFKMHLGSRTKQIPPASAALGSRNDKNWGASPYAASLLIGHPCC